MIILFNAMLCSLNVIPWYVTTAIIHFVKLKISCFFKSNWKPEPYCLILLVFVSNGRHAMCFDWKLFFILFTQWTRGDTCSCLLPTLFELLIPPPSCAELGYTGMLWTGHSEWTASFIIHIQLSSHSISCWMQLLCDQRPVHSWGRYCFKAAGNDLSSDGGWGNYDWKLRNITYT